MVIRIRRVVVEIEQLKETGNDETCCGDALGEKRIVTSIDTENAAPLQYHWNKLKDCSTGSRINGYRILSIEKDFTRLVILEQ